MLKILYIHGIGQHPEKNIYMQQWNNALRRTAYFEDVDTDMVWWSDLREGESRRTLQNKESRLPRFIPTTNTKIGTLRSMFLHAIDPVVRRTTKEFVHDVYLYWYGGIRDEILSRTDAAFRGMQPDVIISHSWGTVIAYDYLINTNKELDGFITLGSPLGNDYIKRKLVHANYPERVGRWLNVYDASDPVTWPDRRISNDYRAASGARVIRDVEIPKIYDSKGKRYPHSTYGYLMSEPVQNEIFKMEISRAIQRQK